MNSAQDQANAAAALGGMMGVGVILFAVVVWFAVMAFMIWLFYRIFTKAGMSGALAFLMLVPGVGPLIVVCILAFGTWKVVPAPPYGYTPTPLAGGYPPQQLPPSSYPQQQQPPSSNYPSGY